MVQKTETKAINKLCVREILSLSFVCGTYFFEFRGRNLVCFVIAYNFNGKYAPEAGKTRMRTAFFTRVITKYFPASDTSKKKVYETLKERACGMSKEKAYNILAFMKFKPIISNKKNPFLQISKEKALQIQAKIKF